MRGTKALLIGAALVVAGLSAGCSGGSATPTERLWISELPTNAKTDLAAFVTMRSEGDQYLGAFFEGTVLRGSHDVFRWKDTGKNRATVTYLQDERSVVLTLSTCEPDRLFDYCLEVKGDRRLKGRYQSRKRWVVRRPGRKRDAVAGLVIPTMVELAQDDAELAAVLDAAVAEGSPQ